MVLKKFLIYRAVNKRARFISLFKSKFTQLTLHKKNKIKKKVMVNLFQFLNVDTEGGLISNAAFWEHF